MGGGVAEAVDLTVFATDTVVDVEGLDFVLEGGDELGESLQPLEGVGLVGRADVDVETCGRVNRKRGMGVLAHHVEHFPYFIEALSIILHILETTSKSSRVAPSSSGGKSE